MIGHLGLRPLNEFQVQGLGRSIWEYVGGDTDEIVLWVMWRNEEDACTVDPVMEGNRRVHLVSMQGSNGGKVPWTEA